ncbi:Venom phosphodiesterase-like protein [Drosera capensis]
MGSHDPKWWLGEPLWETVVNHGLKAAAYFWPRSEVKKGNWSCPDGLCMFYNGSVPFEERIDTVLRYFDLDDGEIPSFMTLYFEDPDHQSHQVGPDDPEITEAVARIDRMIGRLIDGLEKRGVLRIVPASWVQSYTPLLAIRPPQGYSAADVVEKMLIPPVIGLLEEGFKVEQKWSKRKECGGAHRSSL